MPYVGKSPSAVGVRSRYYFTASGGETSLSGSDNNGKTLVFTDAAYVDVILNGNNLVSGTDYVAVPNTNTISGLAALVANDVVEIISYDVFSVSDTVPASTGGTFSGSLTVSGNIAVTGTVDSRDVAADGTKLDGIEAAADVTDATNVAAAGALMTTGGSVTGNVTFGDNNKVIFGAGSDLQIYHNGTDSFIDENASGWLYIRANDLVLGKYTGETYVKGEADGAVTLYHNNVAKLATTATGVDVTGTATVDQLTIDSVGAFGSFDSKSTISTESAFAGSDKDFRIKTTGGNVNHFVVQATTGNVGIGCAPDSALEIRTATNSSSDTTYLKLSNLGENVGHIDFENGNGNLARITGTKLGSGASANDGILTFSTALNAVLSERMRIDTSGNVGIGTSSMVRTLEITDGTSGKIRAKGTDGGFIECHNGTNGVYFGTAPAVLGTGNGGDSVIFTDSGFNQLYYTSGVERMRIDTSGRVTMPNQPAFHAHGTSTSWTVFSNGGWSTIVLPATTFNTGNHYNTASSAFTAPVTGVYHFYYKIYGRVQSGAPASTYWQSRFQKNNSGISGHGSMLTGYQYNTGGADETVTYSMNISLAANDQITLHAQSAGAYNGEYYPINCEFGGYLIG